MSIQPFCLLSDHSERYEFQKSSDGRYGGWENATGWNGMIGDLLAGVCAELQMYQCKHVEMDI